MTDFHAKSIVTARKRHQCEHCGCWIEVGEKHSKTAQVWEGDFLAYREHLECNAVWHELNFVLRGIPLDEGAPFLRDDDIDDRERDWIKEDSPLVAGRMGYGVGVRKR